MPKTIAIIGTLDTKGPEVSFLRDLIQARGHRACVIDPGVLDQPAIEADVTRQQVSCAGGAELADLIAAGDKGRAMQTMMDGARAIVTRLYAEGQLDGVLAVGGGQGTAIGTAAMQALPIGVPKLMVSTITSGLRTFEPYIGQLIAQRLNHAQGPAAILIPMCGFSYADRPGHPFHDPEADTALVTALEANLDSKVQMIVAYPTGQRQFRTEV